MAQRPPVRHAAGRVAAAVLGLSAVEMALPEDLATGRHTLVAAGVDPDGVPRHLTRPVTVGAVLAYTGST